MRQIRRDTELDRIGDRYHRKVTGGNAPLLSAAVNELDVSASQTVMPLQHLHMLKFGRTR